MKIVFIMFCILQSPNGEDVFKTKTFQDRGVCEYVRAEKKSKGYIVGDNCARMTYSVGQ